MKQKSLWTRDFTMVVVGQIISLFGNAILRFALPLYLLEQTASPAIVGIASACAFIPMIVLSPIGGVVADRINKKNIMVWLDFSTAILTAILGVALGKFPIVPLIIAGLMLLYGIQGAYQPAVQASLPLLADEENLLPANAIINQVSALSGLLGPALGGVLYGGWGIYPILIVGGVCFLCSAVMEIFIHIPHTAQPAEQGVIKIVVADLQESLHFMRKGKPILLRIIGLICMFNLFMSAMLIIGLMVILKTTLGISDEMYGLSQGILAAGGLFGGVLAGLFAEKLKIHRAHLLLFGCALFTVPIGLALLFKLPVMVSFCVIAASSFVLMALSTLFSIQMLTYVQRETPMHLVGKVISCLLALSMCAQPVGQAMYGILFELFSNIPWAIVLTASVVSAFIAFAAHKTFAKLK